MNQNETRPKQSSSKRSQWYSYRRNYLCKNDQPSSSAIPSSSNSASVISNGEVRSKNAYFSGIPSNSYQQQPNRNFNNSSQTTRRRNCRFPDSRQRHQFTQNVRQNLHSNRGRRTSRSRQNREEEVITNLDDSREQQSPVPLPFADLAVNGPTEEESDIPGFAYDPKTCKYFRVQGEASGSAIGYRRSDLYHNRREKERLKTLRFIRNTASSQKAFLRPISFLLKRREMAHRSVIPCVDLKTFFAETTLSHAKDTPSYVQEVLSDSIDYLAGCQFLDVAKDGKTLFGCWAVNNGPHFGNERLGSRFIALNVRCDPEIIRQSGRAKDDCIAAWQQQSGNTFGLKFEATPNIIHVLDPTFVDMVIAPYDSDVTCVLYVTASSRFLRGKVATYCSAVVEPVPELCTNEGLEYVNSPVYNMKWTSQDEIWSCAWNSGKMRLGLGMEDNTMIIDVLSEKNFRISSRKKNVLSQQFTQEGEILFMGLRGNDMVCSDLRLKSRHIVNTFHGSNSVGWIKLLHTHPYSLLTDNFAGELKLWDLRMNKVLMSYKGHKNSHYRLPCFVDEDERFVFAVGEDGIARGWSMRTGEMLCSLPGPLPSREKSEYTRIAFSDHWGGRAGNSAIVLAVEGDLRVHELEL